jgi:hypothetical protein
MKSKPARPSIPVSGRKDCLQMLSLVLRNPAALQPADLRMVTETLIENGSPAPMESSNENEAMVHRIRLSGLPGGATSIFRLKGGLLPHSACRDPFSSCLSFRHGE